MAAGSLKQPHLLRLLCHCALFEIRVPAMPPQDAASAAEAWARDVLARQGGDEARGTAIMQGAENLQQVRRPQLHSAQGSYVRTRDGGSALVQRSWASPCKHTQRRLGFCAEALVLAFGVMPFWMSLQLLECTLKPLAHVASTPTRLASARHTITTHAHAHAHTHTHTRACTFPASGHLQPCIPVSAAAHVTKCQCRPPCEPELTEPTSA